MARKKKSVIARLVNVFCSEQSCVNNTVCRSGAGTATIQEGNISIKKVCHEFKPDHTTEKQDKEVLMIRK